MKNQLRLILQYTFGEKYYLGHRRIAAPCDIHGLSEQVIVGKYCGKTLTSRINPGSASEIFLDYLRVQYVLWRLNKFFKEFIAHVPPLNFGSSVSTKILRIKISRKFLISIIYFFLIFTISTARAQCVSIPPTTGLGSCIDFMAATSSTATRQIQKLRYKFRYDKDSYTDYMERIIYIQSYDCNNSETTGLYARLSLLAHELGHAEYGLREDVSSRSAFIKTACDSEGNAVLNNIKVRSETLACSMNSVDIGIIASNAAELLSIYKTSGSDIQSLGQAFCENNFTSTTKQNYLDYYGGHYDLSYQ